MTDRPAIQRRLDSGKGAAGAAVVRLDGVAERSRRCLALVALAVTAATALLPVVLRGQEAAGGDPPPAKGKVVVEHSTGDLELPAPAAPVARSGRLVRLSGLVRDTLDGESIGGARVEVLGTRIIGRSDDEGRFHLAPLPPGRYSVRVTRIGYQPATIDDVRFPEDVEGAPLSVVMRRGSVALSEVVVTPGHFGLLQTGITGGQSLSRETLETIPQLGEDIYRAVSRLPGVSADDFSAKFSVRGGSGDELYVSLDGLELVEPFHLKDVGGAFSIIDIQTLGTASLSTGGFSAEYGDRLTGVFTLKTSDPRTDGVHGSVGVSAMNARATMQGGFAGGKGGWLVSARPGYLDVALKFTEIADSIQPRYYDVFAKAQYDLPRGGRIAMHVLRAGDNFRFLKKDEPNIFSSYGSSYGWLTWDNAMVGGRLRMQTVASVGALSWQRHGENYASLSKLTDKSAAAVVGALLPSTATTVQTAEIDDSRSLERVGFRQDWTFDATPRLMFKWGADAKRETAAYDYFRLLGTPRTDRPRSGRDSVSNQLAPRADKLALYFAPRVQVLSSLTIEVGARLDRSTLTDESILSPRLNVSWQPRERTVVRAAWGAYSQSQPLFSLQTEDGVSSFAPAERAEQRTIGIEHSMQNGIVARVETYEKRLTRAHGQYANLGGDLWLFPELLWDRRLIDRTAGLDRGVELQLARSDAERMDWSVGYALSKSTDVVNGRTVPRAFDQRHAIHGDWSLHPRNDSWRLSVGGLWHSGWPYTPTNLSVDTVTNTPTKLEISTWRTPGELNSARLRSYHRVDVRWTKYFHTRSGRLAVFGEVYNLFGTVNPRGYWRDATVDGRKVTLTTGEINQWPRLPVAGFSWQF